MPVEDAEIHGIKQLVSSGYRVFTGPIVTVGQPVVIRGGLFAELRGVVVRVKDALRVVVNVHALAYAIAVEVDAAFVVPDRVLQ